MTVLPRMARGNLDLGAIQFKQTFENLFSAAKEAAEAIDEGMDREKSHEYWVAFRAMLDTLMEECSELSASMDRAAHGEKP